MVEITAVEGGSLAERAGILPGDILIRIGGNEIRDVLDYRFYLTERHLTLLLHRGPELVTVEIKKPEYADIGLSFAEPLMDRQRRCANNCVFCFIDQLPHGMREPLYFKDDDSRMSFLAGSYVTLTNMTERDIDRIIRMHISPIHISVHTTNPELRVRMMGNKRAGKVLEIMRRFADAGIEMHAQIVLCKGWNDGEELERSMRELSALHPALVSVSVVPIGLTCHRSGLTVMEPFTAEDAACVLDRIEAFQERFLAERGTRLIFASDEWYLKAGRALPDEEAYEEYPQLDNGVGLIRSLDCEIEAALADAEIDFPEEAGDAMGRYTIATGYAAAGYFEGLVQRLNARYPRSHGQVIPIRNDFFGHEITVAGLVTGQDLASQLKGRELGDRLLLPYVMLRYERDKFLDDMTPAQLEERIGVPITFTECDGFDVIEKLLHPALADEERKDG